MTLHSLGVFRDENRDQQDWAEKQIQLWCGPNKALANLACSSKKKSGNPTASIDSPLTSLDSKQISTSASVCHSVQWWCKWPGLPPCPAQLLGAAEAVCASRGQHQSGDTGGCMLMTFSPASPSLKGIWVVHLQSFTLCSSGIHFSLYVQEVTPGAAEFWWAFLLVQTLRSGKLVRHMTAPAITVILGATIDTHLWSSPSPTIHSSFPSLSAVTLLLTLVTNLVAGTRLSSPMGLSLLVTRPFSAWIWCTSLCNNEWPGARI